MERNKVNQHQSKISSTKRYSENYSNQSIYVESIKTVYIQSNCDLCIILLTFNDPQNVFTSAYELEFSDFWQAIKTRDFFVNSNELHFLKEQRNLT